MLRDAAAAVLARIARPKAVQANRCRHHYGGSMRTPPRNWLSNPLATALLVLAGLLVHATAPAADQAPQVRVTTNMGDFVIELNPDRAPLTVANFLRYVKEGYYAGTLFHRVVANFVIQGGGHAASDLKLKPVHEAVNNESGNGLQNKRGTVGL